jgi:Ca2+/H+ antiporter
MYFSTSKDILYIVLAFAVLWVAIFLSWTLYYLICILRDARATVSGVKKAADAIEQAAAHVKDKMGAFMNIASIGAEGVKIIMDKMMSAKGKKNR